MTKNAEMRRAADFIRKVAGSPPGTYPESFIALEWGSPVLLQLMSGEKTRLIDYLKKHGPVGSVTELSEALGRAREAVSRDLHVLINAGVVVADKKGKTKTLRASERPILIR